MHTYAGFGCAPLFHARLCAPDDSCTLLITQYDEHEQERAKQQAEGSIEPDDNLVQQLVDMGFNENGSKKACVATKNAGFEEAMEWIFQHSEDPGFEDPSEHEKRAKKKKPRLIPLELQRLFTQLQLLDCSAISTQVCGVHAQHFLSLSGSHNEK